MKLLIPNFNDENLAKLADLIRRLNAGLPRFTEGAFVDVTIETTATNVFHGLGRTPEGYLVTYKMGAGDVWMISKDYEKATFQATVQVRVGLWLF